MSYSAQKSYSNDGDTEDDSVLYKVYVQRIDPEMDEELLGDLFSKHGEPFKVYIHPEKRFGMVYYTSYEEACEAISQFNMKYPFKCLVKMATPPTERITVAELLEMNKKIKQQAYMLARKEACINELKQECENLSMDRFQNKSNYVQKRRYGRINGQYDDDSFESDVSGDVDFSDYPTSRYRNYAETYMNMWMRREMPHIFSKLNGAGDHRSASRQSRYSSNNGDGRRDRSYSRGRLNSHNDDNFETSSQHSRHRSKSSSRQTEQRNFENKKAPNTQKFENKIAPITPKFENKIAPTTPKYENDRGDGSYVNRRYNQQESNNRPVFNKPNVSGPNKNYSMQKNRTDFAGNRSYNGQNKYPSVKRKDGDDGEAWGEATQKHQERSSLVGVPRPNLISKPNPSRPQVPVKQYKCVVPCRLPEDIFTDVKVEYMESETTGWVSLVKDEDFNLDVLAKVNDLPKKPMSPFVNDICMAQYDGIWNRAVVLKVLPNKFLVRFIDFGNTEYVTGGLCELDEEMKNIGGQVVKIRLDDGSGCKLEDQKVMKVKPVRKEGEIIVVHVPNGYYPMNKQATVKPPFSSSILNKKQTSNKINGFSTILEHFEVGDVGFLAVRSLLGKNNCTITIASQKFVHQIEIVENLGKEYENLNGVNHIAHIGDYVAALCEDKWSRAIVLGTENDKKAWRVAFLDEGVCHLVSRTFPLQDKDFDIPEFACLCSIVSVQDNKCEFEVQDIFLFNVISITRIPELTVKCQLRCEKTEENVAVVNLVQWRPKVLDANESLIDVPSSKDVFMASYLPVARPESGDVVYLCNVRSQNEACIQNLKMQKNASDLHRKMQRFADKLTSLSNPPIVNQLVVCKFSGDGEWYRAEIRKTLGATVEVMYIDYGNIEDINVTLLREMLPEFTDVPTCVCKVTLKDVPKQSFTVQQKSYLPAVLGNVKFNIFYEGSIENGVTLVDKSGEIFNKKILSLRTSTPEPKTSTPISNNGRFQDNFSPSTSKVESTNKNVAKVSSPGGSCVSESKGAVRKQRSLPNSESDKSEVSVGRKTCREVKKDEDVTVPVRVLPKGNAELVYLAEIDIAGGLISVCTHDANEIEFATETLTAQIDEYVRALGPSEPHVPEEGGYCLALFDDVWYRAMCMLSNKKEVTVVFIDFGNVAAVSPKDIKKLPERFAKYTALSAVCKIDGLPDLLSPEQETKLASLITPQHVYSGEVLSSGEDNIHVVRLPHVTAAFD